MKRVLCKVVVLGLLSSLFVADWSEAAKKKNKPWNGCISLLDVEIATDFSFADVDSAAKIRKSFAEAQKITEGALTAIVHRKSEAHTLSNTLFAMENALSYLDDHVAAIGVLRDVSPDSAIRDAATEVAGAYETYRVEIYSRVELYEALNAALTKFGNDLEPEAQRMAQKYIQKFQAQGVTISDPVLRERASAVSKELVKIESDFRANIANHKVEIPFTAEELSGLPAPFFKSYKQNEAGAYLVDAMRADHLDPVMKYVKNGDIRRRLHEASLVALGEENGPIFAKALQLRQELAKAFGYPSFAHFVQAPVMAGNPDRVRQFLKDLQERLKPRMAQDIAEMLKLKQEDEPGATEVFAWDHKYYSELYKQKYMNFNSSAFQKYFPSDATLPKVLDAYGDLYGISFVEALTDTWHESVRAFDLIDKKSLELIATLYFDLYPRDSKRKGAAAYGVLDQKRLPNGKRRAPVGVIVANFSTTGYLPHNDLITLAHELGHQLHNLLTRTKYASTSGFNTVFDFVEVPSQANEAWMWDAEFLKRISSPHPETYEYIDDKMIESLLATNKTMVSVAASYLLSMSQFDLEAHANQNVDPFELWATIRSAAQQSPTFPREARFANIKHMMGGYQGILYTYLWSRRIDEAIVGWFQESEQSLHDRVRAARYRQLLLERGDSADPNELIEELLGGPVTDEAFYRYYGL